MSRIISIICRRSLITFLIIVLFIFIIFFGKIPELIWLVLSIAIVFLFFHFLDININRNNHINRGHFKKQLFTQSLFIRIIGVIFIYIFFSAKNGTPYEFYAADSVSYNRLGNDIADLLKSGQYNLFEKLWYIGFSDLGFPVYAGILYTIFFKSILALRIINAVLGAFSCVHIYKIARRNFNEETARIAGIITMLLPNLIYYCGLHLKETLMVFLLVALYERADFIFHNTRIRAKDVIVVGLFSASLFMFRTVLATSAILSISAAFLLAKNIRFSFVKRFGLVLCVGLFIYVFLFQKINSELETYWQQQQTNQQSQMSHFSTRANANEFAQYGKTAIFAPIILFAPFPTLVNIRGQENHMMLAGAYFTRNIYAFFVLLSFIVLIRTRQLRKYLMPFLFIVSYLAILAKSGFALSERFHLPVLPFMAIFAAHGILNMNLKRYKAFNYYLIIIGVVIIGWNWFKLAGRGII